MWGGAGPGELKFRRGAWAANAAMDELLSATEPRDAFALMLHDRVVQLEAAVLRPRADPALTVSRSRPRAAFVRLRSAALVDADAWARDVLARLAPAGPLWDLWVCQHWSALGGDGPGLGCVTEAVVRCGGGGECTDCERAGHACLDAARAAGAADARVETHGVTCDAWFVESVRAAAAGARRDVTYSWREGRVHDVPNVPGPEAWPDRAWRLLHGWLACQVDAVEPWHPRALSAGGAAAEFVTRLVDVLPGHM